MATGDVKLTEKKLTALVPVSNDLLKNSNIQVDRLIRDDMVRAAANAEDIAYLKGDGLAGQAEGHLLLGRRGRPRQLRRHVAGELAHGHRRGAEPPRQRECADGQARLVRPLAVVNYAGWQLVDANGNFAYPTLQNPAGGVLAGAPVYPDNNISITWAAAPRRRSTTRK
jgi:hypothetical protein